MENEKVTIEKRQLDFLLQTISSNTELESKLVSLYNRETKEGEFKNSFSCLAKLENDLSIQIDYKTKMKYSTKREEQYLTLVNQIKKECQIYQHNSYVYACIVKAKNNLLTKMCQDLIDVLERKTKLGKFILRATAKLKLYTTIKDNRK